MTTSPVEATDRQVIARRIRGRLVRMSHESRAPHLGSALSCVDLLVAAYWGFLSIDPDKPNDPDRDRFILSKGHAASALYITLAERGFFSPDLLKTFGQDGGSLPEQMSPNCMPGIEAATGSLGHGLPLGLGMALASRMQGRSNRVCVVLSDGECNEGTVWEAALFAAAQRVERLVAIVDFNSWQATGRTDDIMGLSPLKDKFQAFGWNAMDVDGHDPAALQDVLADFPSQPGMPTAIIAHTTKGQGVSFMQDDNNWHYRIPNADEVQAALTELGQV